MENMVKVRDVVELEAGLERIGEAPKDAGRVELIARRPAVDARELLVEGELSPAVGLVGDTWNARPSKRTPDQSPHPDMQLTLMSARVCDLVAVERERWPLAGDQLYVDLDLSEANLPAGTRLQIGGQAVVEVSSQPHTGCLKFSARFGEAAFRWVNSPEGRALRLRGLNAKVVQGGIIRQGDTVLVLRGEGK